MQVGPLWRLHRHIHTLLLCVLLSCKIRYVRFHADIILLWLHGLHLLWVLPHVGHCRFPGISAVCEAHISLHKVRVTSVCLNMIYTCCSYSYSSGQLPEFSIPYAIYLQLRIHYVLCHQSLLFLSCSNHKITGSNQRSMLWKMFAVLWGFHLFIFQAVNNS